MATSSLSTTSPRSVLSANVAQPSQALPPPAIALGNYPNQPHWPASANNAPQYNSAPVYTPGDFSIKKADEEPWR